MLIESPTQRFPSQSIAPDQENPYKTHDVEKYQEDQEYHEDQEYQKDQEYQEDQEDHVQIKYRSSIATALNFTDLR